MVAGLGTPRALIKAEACGNDFLLLPAGEDLLAEDLAGVARAACDRRRGVGADGLLVVVPTGSGARTRLYNADGSRSEVSGNGVRCAAAWLAAERGLAPGGALLVETDAGPKTLTLLERAGPAARFRAAMGAPEGIEERRLAIGGAEVTVVVLRVGNPQCVVLGPVTAARLHGIAAPLAVHPAFPEGTNVELAEVERPDRVRILIWERGVGPTESSGTGACAAAVAASVFGGAARDVDVVAPGGVQRVTWTEEGLWLTGWASLVARVEWWPAPAGGAHA